MTTKKTKIMKVAGIAAATFALGIAGCAGTTSPEGPLEEDVAQIQSEQQPAETEDQDDNSGAAEQEVDSGSDGVDAHAEFAIAAGRLAESAVPGARVVAMDLEDDRSKWEIDLYDADGQKHEVDVDFEGTTILQGPRVDDEDAEDRAENRAELGAATVDFEDVIQILAAEFPGATLDDLELDEDDGRVKWEADLEEGGQDFDVKVDASNGEIIEVDR